MPLLPRSLLFPAPWGLFSACSPVQDTEPLTPISGSMVQFTPAEVLSPAGMDFGKAGCGSYRAACSRDRAISKPIFFFL